MHPVSLECHSFVLGEHRGAIADLPIPIPNVRRYVGHLEPAGLARRDATAESREGSEEECLDVVRLKPTGLGIFHAPADLVDICFGQHVVVERTLGEQTI